jgi:hypothetical protein
MRGINHSDDWGWANVPRKGSGGGGQNTVVQQSGPPAQVLANYNQAYGQAQNVAQQPYPTYNGSLIAGFTPQQVAGFNNINTAVNAPQPFLNAASQAATNSTSLLNPQNFASTQSAYMNPAIAGFSPQNFGSTVGQYYSPYANSVIAPTQALFNEQNAQQLNQVRGNAGAQGAFGGDREAVAEAQTAQQQQLAEAPTLANLQTQGYQNAVQNALSSANLQQQGYNAATGAAQGNAWLQSQGAFSLGNLGQEAQSLGLQGANAQIGAGGMQQQLAQQELSLPYQQWQAAQGYPYQITNWLSGLATGLGGASGQQGSTTYPGASPLSQVAGLGLSGAGLIGSTGGFGANGWLTGANGLFGGAGAGTAAVDAAALGSSAIAAEGIPAAAAAIGAFGVRRGGRVPDGIRIPRRDDGGAVNPAQSAMFGGNPALSNMFSMYSRMPTEKLQELASRMPQNQFVTRALRSRQMAPQNDPGLAPQAGLAPPQMQASPGGFADGGEVGDDDDGALVSYDDLNRPLASYSGLGRDDTPLLAGMTKSALPDNSTVDPKPALGADAGPMPDVGAPPVAGFSVPSAPPMPTPQGRDTGEPMLASTQAEPLGEEALPSEHQTAGLAPSHKDFMASPWGTLLAAGLGILGGNSPQAGVNIGRGGLQGLQFAENARMRELQAENNALYRQGMVGLRGQSIANTNNYRTSRLGQIDQAAQQRQQVADRAAEYRAKGMENNQANAQARLEIARGNQDIAQQRVTNSATTQGITLAQRDRANDLRAQGLAQSAEAHAAQQKLIQEGHDATTANAMIAAAARMSMTPADFAKALDQVKAGRGTITPPAPAVTPAMKPPQDAINDLKANPSRATEFRAKYGVDPSQYLSP